MQKDINTMVMANLFGEMKTEKKAVEDREVKRGFYVDSFYVTNMTFDEYHVWATRKQLAQGNYLFWQ